jgi:phage FluMu protein Com
MKHSDGYTEHFKVVCPDCKAVLMECGGTNGQKECALKIAKTIKWRKCTDLLKDGKGHVNVGA